MERPLSCTLILLSFLGVFGKYVYVNEAKTWPAAQLYCQRLYANLAPISSTYDIKRMQITGKSLSWVGMKSIGDTERWMWWGGGRISWMLWTQSGTSDTANGNDEATRNSDWYDFSEITIPFFCYNPIIVMKRKTWEEAWQYCNKNHNMLASLASEMEMVLIQRKLNQTGITERVWIGLHFFPGDGWLWVDNQPAGYESWGSGGKPGCPPVNMECAALKVDGWSNGNTTSNTSTLIGSAITNVSRGDGAGSGEAEDEEENVWDAHDCEDKLNFICY